jgi:hypothetical protein
MSGKILRENQDFFQFLIEFLSMGIRETKIRNGMNEFYQATVEYFTELVEAGIASGAFKKMNAKKVARAMYFLFIGNFFTFFSNDVDYDPVTQGTFNIDALMNGVLK